MYIRNRVPGHDLALLEQAAQRFVGERHPALAGKHEGTGSVRGSRPRRGSLWRPTAGPQLLALRIHPRGGNLPRALSPINLGLFGPFTSPGSTHQNQELEDSLAMGDAP